MHEKHFFYLLIAAAGLLCFAIFEPYFMLVVLFGTFAIALYPVFIWMNKRLTGGVRWLASALTIVLVAIVILIPLWFIGANVFSQGQSVVLSLIRNGPPTWLVALIPTAQHFQLQTLIQNSLGTIASFLFDRISSISATALGIAFSLFIGILSLFFFLKDGESFVRYLRSISPLSDAHSEKILSRLASAAQGIMRGFIIMGIVQAILIGTGFQIFGVPDALLWGLAAGIASVVPTFGTALVWVPACLFLFATGETFSAVGLVIWSLVLVGTLDNFLSPIVTGSKLDLPPLVMLLSVLGGVALVGPAGVVFGPLATSMFYTMTIIYREDFRAR